MNRPIPEQILSTPVGNLALQSSELLYQFKNDAADLLALAKATVDTSIVPWI